MLTVTLGHTTNPDIGGSGYWSQPIDRPNLHKVAVSCLADAIATVRAFIDRNGLGFGNLPRSFGLVSFDGKPVARISYNGRAWRPSDDWRTREEIDVAAFDAEAVRS